MPNWCANTLIICGEPHHIKELKKLMRGELYPLYKEATDKSIKFFVAACAGIVKPTAAIGVQDQLYFGETEGMYLPIVVGESNNANLAFTQWLNLLKTDPSLDKDTSQKIIDLYEKSGLASISLQAISLEQREIIHQLFEKQAYDWFNCFKYDSSLTDEFWIALDNKSEKCLPFDMRAVLAPKLVPEIVGFNGHLLGNIMSPLCSYSSYIDLYGVKWPCGTDLSLSEDGDLHVEVCFDTPWSPPSTSVLTALSQQYQCSIEHYYSESGCAYCGFASYEHGELVEQAQDNLEFGFENEEGYCDVIGPSYILDRVSHFGG